MNFTLVSQGKILNISRIDDTNATIHGNLDVHLYVKWYIWPFNREKRKQAMTRQVRMIVGQLIEDGWDCVYVG